MYSKAELVSAQAAIRASQQAQGSCRAASPSRRAEQLGSQLHFNTEKLLVSTSGHTQPTNSLSISGSSLGKALKSRVDHQIGAIACQYALDGVEGNKQQLQVGLQQWQLHAPDTPSTPKSHPPPQAETPEGSVLFSYVHTDEFCERAETSKAVSTSESERGNHLVQKLLHDARNRQKVNGHLAAA